MMIKPFSSDVFICRTLKLVEWYEKLADTIEKNDFYDVTLLVNCLYGLLMVALKKQYDNIPNTIDADTYLKQQGITKGITITTTLSAKPLFRDMLTGIRNGLAHWEEVHGQWNGANNVQYGVDSEGHVTALIIEGTIQDNSGTITVEFDLTQGNPVLELVKLIRVR
jgi:hypothetical protein